MAAWLLERVQRSFGSPSKGVTEKAVFGDVGAGGVVRAIGDACREHLGAHLGDGFLYEVSSGVVVGCSLTDGRRVVIKAYQPRWGQRFLARVKEVQGHLHAAGYPCPEPLDVELRVGDAHALAESELRDPGVGRPTEGRRATLALGLAQLIDLCRGIEAPELGEHPLRRPHEGVFPEPHSPLFDFEATQRGAEWIDEIAARAHEVARQDPSAPVVAHTDWSLRNVRVRASEVAAVYDWDSLALVREAEAVAAAAATWCKAGGPGDRTPTLGEIRAFAEDYDAASSLPLGTEQRRAFEAATVYGLAYTARCEHALDPDGTIWRTTRPRLREAAALLS